MANEITSMIGASRPVLATDAGQVVNSKTPSSAENTTTQSLPDSGRDLPFEATAKQPREPADIEEAVGKINDYLQVVQRDLSFRMDDDSGRIVIQVLERSSGEVVRQIPTEEVLAIASQFDVQSESGSGEALQGMLFSGIT
jgi:flagellar protein FlaG